MNEEQIAHITTRLGAARKRPWKSSCRRNDKGLPTGLICAEPPPSVVRTAEAIRENPSDEWKGRDVIPMGWIVCHTVPRSDAEFPMREHAALAEFLAKAPEDIEALLHEVARARASEASLRSSAIQAVAELGDAVARAEEAERRLADLRKAIDVIKGSL